MKKIILFLLLLTSLTNFAQTDKVITNDEEYNYLTNGYKESIKNGTGFKEGYELVKIDVAKSDGFTATYSLLKEKSSNLNKAVSIVLTKDKDKEDKVIYLCLPFNNADLLAKFYKDVEKLGISMGMFFQLTVLNNFSKSMDKISNRCK